MDLEGLLERQGRLVTRAQLTAAGVSARQCSGVGPRVVRVRRGVCTDLVLDDLTAPARTRLQIAAARLISGVDLVAAGATAALVHDVPVLDRRPVGLQLVERKHDRPRHHGASTTLSPDEVVDLGVPVTTCWPEGCGEPSCASAHRRTSASPAL